jgi:hypothetical protein
MDIRSPLEIPENFKEISDSQGLQNTIKITRLKATFKVYIINSRHESAVELNLHSPTTELV